MRALFIIILCHIAKLLYADELDELFATRPSVAEVTCAINALDFSDFQKRSFWQSRAIQYYKSARAYKKIVEPDLSSSIAQRRRFARGLVIATFEDYLAFYPPPELDDALELVEKSKTFETSALIFFNKLLLKNYISSDDYIKITRAGRNTGCREYKKATERLIAQTFFDYLKKNPKPSLARAISIIKNNGNYTTKELISFKQALLNAYTLPGDLLDILKDSLGSEVDEYRDETRALALQRIDWIIKNGHASSYWVLEWEWLKRMRMHAATIDFKDALDEQITSSYRHLLKSEKTDAELLALSEAMTKNHDLEFFFHLRKVHISARPLSRDLIFADCFKFDEIQARNCVTFLREFDPNLPSSDYYQVLVDLKRGGYANSRLYELYQIQLENTVLTRLQSEVQKYYGEEHIPFYVKKVPEKVEIQKQCPICFIDFSDLSMHHKYSLWQCEHMICKECLKEHIKNQLEEVKPILCPYRSCNCLLLSKDFAALDMPEAERQSIKNDLRAAISSISGATFCNNGQCLDALIPQQDALDLSKKTKKAFVDHHYTCRTCAKEQCPQCGYAHRGISCDKLEKELKKRQKEAKHIDKRIYKGKNSIYKACPKCKIFIEKDQGCDHMTCKKCNHEFWWSNGKPYL